jgi:hypothetical protein
MDAGLDEVAVVLVDDALAELLESLAIRLVPPVSAAATRRVEIGAQEVDRVREVVSNPDSRSRVVRPRRGRRGSNAGACRNPAGNAIRLSCTSMYGVG